MNHRLALTCLAFAVVSASCGGTDEPTATPESSTPSTTIPDAPTSTSSPSSDVDVEDDLVEPDVEPPPEIEPESVFPRTVTDALGREFVLDEPASIGCVWTGCDELHASLGAVIGAGSPLAGYEDSPMFYPVGPPAFVPSNAADVEAWAEAEIDFVISRVPENPLLSNLEGVVNVFYLHHPSYGDSTSIGFQAYLDNLDLVGQLLGRDGEAVAAVQRLETMVEELSELSTPETKDRSVAILFAGEGYQVIGDENPFCDVLALTGLGDCLDYDTSEIGAEAMLQEDPDWIVYQGGADTSSAARTDPTWERLSAVQAGQVIDSRFGQYYCCGDRTLVFGLQEFVAATLPDAGISSPGDPTTFDPDASPLFG